MCLKPGKSDKKMVMRARAWLIRIGADSKEMARVLVQLEGQEN